MKHKLIVYWSRRDFRLADNPALKLAMGASVESKVPLLPLYCIDKKYITNPEETIGYPRRQMLYRCLADFSSKFEVFFVTESGYRATFQELSHNFDLEVFCNDDVEPYARLRDKEVKDIVEANNGTFFRIPEIMSVSLDTRSKAGSIYTMFTPFKNSVLSDFLAIKPLDSVDPSEINFPANEQLSVIEKINQGYLLKPRTLSNLSWLLKKSWTLWVTKDYEIDLGRYFELPDLHSWTTNENQVLQNAQGWISNKMNNYNVSRDQLGIEDGTSSMSYALKWGLISTRTLVKLILQNGSIEQNIAAQTYISELLWREFYKYILYHFPYVLDVEHMQKRRSILWVGGGEGKRRFEAWIKGETGFDIVDAAMKQIVQTGWMHNRARMITASILTKNLGVDWRWGQSFFRATLVDLDEASNNGGWQWSASVGVDPKPIRIFNPYTQEEKFDKNHTFRDKWLQDRQPVNPIVDYKLSRQEALERYRLE